MSEEWVRSLLVCRCFRDLLFSMMDVGVMKSGCADFFSFPFFYLFFKGAGVEFVCFNVGSKYSVW